MGDKVSIRAWDPVGLNEKRLNPHEFNVQLAPCNNAVKIVLKRCHGKMDCLRPETPFSFAMNKFTPLGFDSHEAMMLQDAYDAVTKADMWDYLALRSTPGKDGFMFSPAIELAAINAEMIYDGHSGASYAWVMRQMESIAKRGWEAYANDTRAAIAMKQLRIEERLARERSERSRVDPPVPMRSSVCPCREAQGYTSGWCGVAGGGVPACDH